MSFFLSFARMIKFAFQNILRNVWLSFITLTIFLLTLVTVNTVLFMNVSAQSILQTVEEHVQMTVYFLPETSESIVLSAQGYVKGFSQVKDVEYISSEEALVLFEEQHADDEIILESLEVVGENPFGHSLVITAHSSEDFDFITQALHTPEFSEFIKEQDYNDHAALIAKVQSIKAKIGYAGIALACLFGLIAVMIIFNTIRVAIYVHRDEIAIMKLVGANNWFVRGPFILEALCYSFIATVLMACILFALFALWQDALMHYFGTASDVIISYFYHNSIVLFLAQFGVLSVLSLLTTAFAMRAYLRT